MSMSLRLGLDRGTNRISDGNAAEVIAFEVDDRLVPILADTLRDFDNVTVINEAKIGHV